MKIIKCDCGCGQELEEYDGHYRKRKYVNGHNGRKYKDVTQHKREWNHRNRKSRYESKVARGHKLKGKVVRLMGGECTNCGLKYTGENACVFQIHHKEPSKKSFVVNTRTLISYAWSRILLETKKCLLLCSNCHFIHHNKKY